MMESRTLEITLQYAKQLYKVNLISKMDVYAVVSISGGDEKSMQKRRTPADHDGGSNPTWEFPVKFTVEEEALQQNRLMLDFNLICERALGDKPIGEVHVPLKELLDSQAANGAAAGKKFVSYQVRKPSGRPKGQLTFSYQFGGKNNFSETAPTPVVKTSSERTVAYPVVEMESSSVYPPEDPGGYAPPQSYDLMRATEAGGGGPAGLYPPLAGIVSDGAPPPGVYPPPPFYDYPPPPSVYLYPPPPSQPLGKGYYCYPPQPGYGYSPARATKNHKFDQMGLGAGLLGGAAGGLVIGDMIYWD